MLKPMVTKNTTGGGTVESTHKYNFNASFDWSLASNNASAFTSDTTTLVPFNAMQSMGYPIGKVFIQYTHENTTDVLQNLEKGGMVEVWSNPSMIGEHLYTEGGPPCSDKSKLVQIPCNAKLPPGCPVGNGMVMCEVPASSTILNMGHLERIFNHAMHILWEEMHDRGESTVDGGTRLVGPGWAIHWYETGTTFYSSETNIEIRFHFNGYPVKVHMVHLPKWRRNNWRRNPCTISITPDLEWRGPPPVVSRTTRWLWRDETYEGPSRAVEVWADDNSFVDVAHARSLGWDVSKDPSEIKRRAKVERAVEAARAAAAAAAATAKALDIEEHAAFAALSAYEALKIKESEERARVRAEAKAAKQLAPLVGPSGPAPPSLSKTRPQLNREKRDRKKRAEAARRKQAEEAAERAVADITDMVAEGMRGMGLEVVVNIGEPKPPSAALKRWQWAIQRQIKLNRHDKEATAKNKAASEERARVRAAAEAAKAAKKPAPFTPAGPSGPAPKPPEMPAEAPTGSQKAKQKGKKAISQENGLRHGEDLRAREELRQIQQEERAEARRKGKEIGGW